MDWILALAGILFGGGMIGQIVMYFIKRADEKKKAEQDYYRVIYNKLIEYCSALENLLLTCFKENHKYASLTESANSLIDDNISKIEKLQTSIETRVRSCLKNGKPSDNICKECHSEQQLMEKLLDECKTTRQEAYSKIELMENYWHNNLEQTFSVISSYVNIENLLYSRKGCDNNVISCIKFIDKATLKICRCLSFRSSSESDFEDGLIKQIGVINGALKIISEHL
ncbi:MAG: hypothetical protein ACI3ZQ_08410 [Candidatus Cryptobacteroides sp.]